MSAFKKLVFAVGALATFGSAMVAHADLADIKARGYMTVATEDDYSPFNYIVDGKPAGFHADLLEDLKAFGKARGIEVRQEIMPWTGLLGGVTTGKFDAAFTGSVVTDERLRVFDFAPPFAPAQHFFVKRKTDTSITGDVKSLCGKTVGLQGGSSFEARLPELDKMLDVAGCERGELVKYQSYTEAFADLASGRIDYAITSLIAVNDVVRTRPEVFAKGFAVSGGGFNAWAIPKNNPQLRQFFTDFMTEVRSSGRLAALQVKWFGEAFPDMPAQPITSVSEFHTLAGL
ncbi:transporter substrate-binding domain-containing protein [Pseudomonas sp. NPDC089422]|uniref:transporter substrate-binding domain-containing protein n=1 Tax=Pseudomonas sp. NPDC089422 TaxID=3364466 RepID=UPI00382D1973